MDMSAAPIINFAGERVALGPVRRDLLPLYLRWRNDFAVIGNLIDVNPITLEQEIARYDNQMLDTSSVRFQLYDRATLHPIGIAAYNTIDDRNSSTEYSIIIGEAAFRGRGYGTEATRLMLDYAFTALQLHSVWLEVFEFNTGAVRAYEKAGFRHAGRRRQAHFHAGRLWDILYMDCLTQEFESPVLRHIFVPDLPGPLAQPQRSGAEPSS